MVLCFPWEAWDCCWACWYKILCLQVNKPHNLQISIINHFVCAGLPLSSLQTGFSQRCPWELFMCCLNKHNWKESTLSKLHCWLYRAKPTVSYNSPATPMIRSVKADFVLHKIFALVKLHVKKDIWKTICHVFKIANWSWLANDFDFTLQVVVECQE